MYALKKHFIIQKHLVQNLFMTQVNMQLMLNSI